MKSLITGRKISNGKGHITETITSEKLSIMFDNCMISSIFDRINHYHDHCIQIAIKNNYIIIPMETNNFILESIKSITYSIFHSMAYSQYFSMGIISTFKYECFHYIKHAIIAPKYPENTYIIEKL